jgi:alanine racemase
MATRRRPCSPTTLPGAEHDCLTHDLVPVLNGLDQLERWHLLARSAGRTLDAVLQFDTGMARLGLSAIEVAQFQAEPERLDHVNVRLVMSHLEALPPKLTGAGKRPSEIRR